jgi:hypothetical protein
VSPKVGTIGIRRPKVFELLRSHSKCREIASEWFREVHRRFVMFAEVRTCLQGCEVSVGCVRVCENVPRV